MKVDLHGVEGTLLAPLWGLEPSEADIRMFMQSGGDYHIIVCYPYDIASGACYDRIGNLRQLDVLDVEIEKSPVARDIEEMFGEDNN